MAEINDSPTIFTIPADGRRPIDSDEEDEARDGDDDDEAAGPDAFAGMGTDAAQLAEMLQQNQENPRRKTSAILSNRVKDCIEAVPMNQGMTWAEFSSRCYERFGRYNPNHKMCGCGGSFCGASGICRKCGQKTRVNKQSRGGRAGPDLCWTQDLYELTSPLLDPSVNLNHSEQQYALRAVSQRLKSPPWDWNGKGTPLRSAVDAGCADLVFVMLQAGIDPNETDARGVTPLHAAVFAGRLDLSRLLLDGRSRVDARDKHGQTALFFAGSVAGCALLCEFQADISAVNLKGQTALHFAARAGLTDVLEWLSGRCSQAVIDLRDAHGATAEHFMKLSRPKPAEEGSESLGMASMTSSSSGRRPVRTWNARGRGVRAGSGSTPAAGRPPEGTAAAPRSSSAAAGAKRNASWSKRRSSARAPTNREAESSIPRPSSRRNSSHADASGGNSPWGQLPARADPGRESSAGIPDYDRPLESTAAGPRSSGGLCGLGQPRESAEFGRLSFLGGLSDLDDHPEDAEDGRIALDDAF